MINFELVGTNDGHRKQTPVVPKNQNSMSSKKLFSVGWATALPDAGTIGASIALAAHPEAPSIEGCNALSSPGFIVKSVASLDGNLLSSPGFIVKSVASLDGNL